MLPTPGGAVIMQAGRAIGGIGCGGGTGRVRPGEVSKAHLGVLFLDKDLLVRRFTPTVVLGAHLAAATRRCADDATRRRPPPHPGSRQQLPQPRRHQRPLPVGPRVARRRTLEGGGDGWLMAG